MPTLSPATSISARMSRPSKVADRAPVAPVAPIAPERSFAGTPTGCAPRIVGIDEVALEMRRQHAARPSRLAPLRERARRSSQHLAQRIRSARDGRRAKRGHAELRQTRRNRGNHIAAIERVEALEPMHVHVDETGQHDVTAQIDPRRVLAPVAPASHPLAPIAAIRSPSMTSVPSDWTPPAGRDRRRTGRS